MLDELNIQQSLEQLAKLDSRVERAVQHIGNPPPRQRPSGFMALVSIVIGQQLSTKAAASIEQRVVAILPQPSAAGLLQLSVEELRSAGLSQRKVEYLRGLSEEVEAGRFAPNDLSKLDDNAVIEAITHLRGFGVWTAKIYLLFSLQRPDVFPENDLALLKAIERLYQLPQKPTPVQGAQLIEHWAPYRSVGSLFLWHYYHHHLQV